MRRAAAGLAALAGLLMAGWSDGSELPSPGAAQQLDSQALHARASALGQQISRAGFQLLSSNLQKAIQQGGPTNALSYCSAAALTLTESVGKPFEAKVRRISHRVRNPKASPNPAELVILEQFRAMMRVSTNTPPAVTTNLEPRTPTYFAPIVLNNPLCLQCHGEPVKDIQPATLAVLKQLYPGDQATGFRIGELRGAWRIDIPERALASAGNP